MPAESLRPYLWMLTGCLSFALMTVLAKWAGNFYEWQVLAIERTRFGRGAGVDVEVEVDAQRLDFV